jgi:hypothetical protein
VCIWRWKLLNPIDVGKLAEENPDLPMGFVQNILVSLQEIEAGCWNWSGQFLNNLTKPSILPRVSV